MYALKRMTIRLPSSRTVRTVACVVLAFTWIASARCGFCITMFKRLYIGVETGRVCAGRLIAFDGPNRTCIYIALTMSTSPFIVHRNMTLKLMPEFDLRKTSASLCIPLWWFILALGASTIHSYFKARSPHGQGTTCERCGYDRSGLPASSPCPECGGDIPVPPTST